MPIIDPSFAEVIDPGRFSLPEAVGVARRLGEKGMHVPERLSNALQTETDLGRAERVLEILPHVAARAQLVEILNEALPLTEARVRSKVWKLYVQATEDPSWALAHLDDPDARVAANIVEALWRSPMSAELHEVYLRAATQPRNRVASCGVVGLLISDSAEGPEHVRRMVANEDVAFRASGAWVIGKACWEAGRELLEPLRGDEDAKVRMNAEKALGRLNRKLAGAV